jgi:hypothetical protein
MMERLPRAALFALALTAVLVLNATTIAQAPPGSLWYNGDFNGVNGLANQRFVASVYDDFDVTAVQGWNVTAVFSDNLARSSIVGSIIGADWEIRIGVSEGNAGTLIASGTTQSPSVVPTGRGGFGDSEFMVEVTGLNIFLPILPVGQHYWLNVTPAVAFGIRGVVYNSDTSGSNCVGAPCGNDDNAFFNSTTFGYYFHNTSHDFEQPDFSMGVIGTVIPEPTTIALLTCGVGALLIALRRRRFYSNH